MKIIVDIHHLILIQSYGITYVLDKRKQAKEALLLQRKSKQLNKKPLKGVMIFHHSINANVHICALLFLFAIVYIHQNCLNKS